jgi:hypothetical protein
MLYERRRDGAGALRRARQLRLPGPIDTAWTHKSTGPMDKKTEKMTVSSTPLGRRGTPEEIANVYAFLASSEASYVTARSGLPTAELRPRTATSATSPNTRTNLKVFFACATAKTDSKQT